MREIVAAIICRDSKFLVTQRSESQVHPFKWEFPGGKVEQGESQKEALHRELVEELDINATIGELQVWEPYTNDQGPGMVYFYFVNEFTGTPRPIVAHDLKWVTPLEFLSLDFMTSNGKVARMIAEAMLSDAVSQIPFVARTGDQPWQ